MDKVIRGDMGSQYNVERSDLPDVPCVYKEK